MVFKLRSKNVCDTFLASPLNYSYTYSARLPVQPSQASGEGQERRDPEFPQVCPTLRWFEPNFWLLETSGEPSRRGSAVTQRPPHCPSDRSRWSACIQCAATTSPGTWRGSWWARWVCLCADTAAALRPLTSMHSGALGPRCA